MAKTGSKKKTANVKVPKSRIFGGFSIVSMSDHAVRWDTMGCGLVLHLSRPGGNAQPFTFALLHLVSVLGCLLDYSSAFN